MSESVSGLPTRKQFFQNLGKGFLARAADGGSFGLTLNAVEEHVLTETHENFSLVFHGPTEMPQEQGIYSLESEDLGEFDVFLVPVSRDEGGLVIEAVFNLVHQPKEPRSANA